MCMMALVVASCSSQRCILVKAGDTSSLLAAIEKANTINADSLSKRLYVLIPNGV